MTPQLTKAMRVATTLLLVLIAAGALRYLWIYYKVEPWTRDGRVRADVVQITPDVSGLVTNVSVHDNEVVHRGQILFVIDRLRYSLAVEQTTATANNLRVQLQQSRRENRRDRNLGALVSTEVREQSQTKIEQLQVAIAQAEAALALAQLNLERTEVKASVDGIVTNLDLHPGDYASAGRPEFALIDLESLHVVGYFEETKISKIEIGDLARVRLMGDGKAFNGHVESIAGGIEDRDRSASPQLLANVNPTFNWVRLAQRIPVRIAIDEPPEGVRLISGRTVSVEIIPRTGSRDIGSKR
jgi:RND family efflux transporter MFP subunit